MHCNTVSSNRVICLNWIHLPPLPPQLTTGSSFLHFSLQWCMYEMFHASSNGRHVFNVINIWSNFLSVLKLIYNQIIKTNKQPNHFYNSLFRHLLNNSDSRQHNPTNPLETAQSKHFNKAFTLLTLTSISATIISTSESSRTIFAGQEFKVARYWKTVVTVAPWAIDPNVGKPLKLFSPVLWVAFYTPAAYQLA